MNLTSLSPAKISELTNNAHQTAKRGFIAPAVQKFVDSGKLAEDMSEAIKWPQVEAKDGNPARDKTVKEQVTALNQNIDNHKTKVIKGKATAWPELEVSAASDPDNGQPFAMVINVDALNKAVAAETAKATK